MSISSFESFVCGNLLVDVKEKKNSIEVFFKDNPGFRRNRAYASTSGTATLGGNGGFIVASGSNTATISATTSYNTTGFKLFMKDGLLKCIRREVSHLSVLHSQVSSQGTVNVLGPTPPHNKETFCTPNHLVESFDGALAMNHIQTKVLELAARKGVVVPQKHIQIGAHHQGSSWSNFYSSFDWLAHPLLREIDSPELGRNIMPLDRIFMSPNGESKNFKGLVQHYFGASTNKLLEEVWKTLVVTLPAKGLNQLSFGLAPGLFKNLGFDYFYQLVPILCVEKSPETPRHSVSEGQFKTIVDQIGPKKMVNMLLQPGAIDNFHYVPDIVKMLKDYDCVEKVPAYIRERYPKGIVVDFKFKTLGELHDKISLEYTTIKGEADKKIIPVDEVYMKLNNRAAHGLKLVVPTNTVQLKMWGSALSICVASYGDRAVNGDTLILGVEKEGVIKYCIEFHTLIINRLGEIPMGSVTTFTNAGPEEECKIIRGSIPMVASARRRIVTMPGTGIVEDRIIPSVIQFRSKHNGNPDPEDENTVYWMLSEWVLQNQNEYKNYGEKAVYGHRMTERGGIAGPYYGDRQHIIDDGI